jgi:hypothetical protein
MAEQEKTVNVTKLEFYRDISHVYLFMFLSLAVNDWRGRAALMLIVVLMYILNFHRMLTNRPAKAA